MNDARRKKIKRALADYEPSQVAKALIGVASSTWWRGEDDPSQYRGGKPPSVDNAFTHAMNLDRIESCIDSFEGRGPEPAANHPGGMSPDEVKRRKEAAKAKWEANRAEG